MGIYSPLSIKLIFLNKMLSTTVLIRTHNPTIQQLKTHSLDWTATGIDNGEFDPNFYKLVQDHLKGISI